MKNLFFCSFFCLIANFVLAQEAEVPKQLTKTFDRYSKAWVNRDWNRVFEITAPEYQKILIKKHGSREVWAKNQETAFKDKITQLERLKSYRIADDLFTFTVLTHGKRPSGIDFKVPGYASFQFIEGNWYLIDPVIPKSLQDPHSP